PDQLRTLEAMAALDLLVQIDTKMSATARVADYVIAVKHPLEMPGMTLGQEYLANYAVGFGTTAPYAQYTKAVVEPPPGSDVIEDWRFFYGLAQRFGLELVVKPVSFAGTVRVAGWNMDMEEPPTTDALFDAVTRGSRIALDEVRRHPAGAIFADPPVFVAGKDPGWTGRFELASQPMLRDLAAVASADELDGAGRKDGSRGADRTEAGSRGAESAWPFRLVSRRQMNVLNSVGCDEPGQQRGRTTNPAYMHPADLAAQGLSPGDLVEIRSPRAAILGVVAPDPHLRRGLVSMTHSWGDGPELDAKVREIGANTGRLAAVDVDYERYTGLPRMSNIPVRVVRAPA
ncbi:molybdopterin dinucleotide-binding protein, partial [Myxococcota bacterium]|nr:molybdopterin dinucleotide-binding protein [Myxococcota bacterium]